MTTSGEFAQAHTGIERADRTLVVNVGKNDLAIEGYYGRRDAENLLTRGSVDADLFQVSAAPAPGQREGRAKSSRQAVVIFEIDRGDGCPMHSKAVAGDRRQTPHQVGEGAEIPVRTDESVCAMIALSGALVIANGPVRAAGDPVSGKNIASRWCAQCHLVDGGRARDAAPPLPAIARDASWTDDRLAAFLTKPHGGMRGFSFSRQEIDNLVAYIGSLEPH